MGLVLRRSVGIRRRPPHGGMLSGAPRLSPGDVLYGTPDPIALLQPYSLVLAHDHRYAKYSDDAGTTVQTADGGAVGSFQNAGTGALPSQATGTAQGTLQLAEVGGQNSLQYDGGDYYDAAISIAVLPVTFFAVVNPTTLAANRNLFGTQTAGAGARLFVVATTGALRVIVDAASASADSSTTLVADTAAVVAAKITAAGAVSYFVNGAPAGTATVADTSPSAANLRLGANATPADFMLGQWPALYMCHGDVPNAVIASVSASLMAWYGVA